jgi:hypothetical protein
MRRSIPHRLWVAMRPLVGPSYRFEIPKYEIQKIAQEKEVSPTCGFVASLKVGLEATVGTLQTGYPRVQALS